MISSPPRVSLLIPAFNAGGYLDALCRSIQAQTFSDFEVRILDDGSTDDTQAVLAPFRSDPRFFIEISQVNRGVGARTRQLLEAARGEFWCSPGADDLLEPDFLERRVRSLEACPEAAFVHGPPKLIDEAGRPLPPAGLPLPELPGCLEGRDFLPLLLQHNVITTTSVVLRRHITQQVLADFQPHWRYAQDWFLWLQHAATDRPVLFDPSSLVRYRIHAQSLTLRPDLQALRGAEIRLVPLCALSAAARYSPLALALWNDWRETLYSLWLCRAVNISRRSPLPPGYLEMGYKACYGSTSRAPSLPKQVLGKIPRLMACLWRERAARRHQRCTVAGLAQINHPFFRST